jgi:conjugative transfer region protein TrbK
MDGKTLARLGAVVFVALAITATAIEMARKEDTPASRPARIQEPVRDPLREGQRRCQQLGEAAANDAECLRVWAETRDRFLGRTPPRMPPASSEGR